MAIRPALGANALETVEAVKKKVAELSQFFPPGVKAIYPYDTTLFVAISVMEVVKTLIEAIASSSSSFIFSLQNWRATLIPTIAVPVVLLGTFGVMAAAAIRSTP
jgi:multidrug efflux pump subunit AcrB